MFVFTTTITGEVVEGAAAAVETKAEETRIPKRNIETIDIVVANLILGKLSLCIIRFDCMYGTAACCLKSLSGKNS